MRAPQLEKYASSLSLPGGCLPAVVQSEEYVFDLIALHARNRPLAEAICSSDRSMTYLKLNGRINILCEVLRDAGVLPGDRVILLGDKTPTAVCAILALLKFGAVCAIVNPINPDERLRYMASHSSCSKVLISDKSSETKARNLGLPIISLPTDWTNYHHVAKDDESQSITTINRTLMDDAVISFTSGSTGQPKGVIYSHGTISNMVAALAKDMNIGPDSRVFQFAAFGWCIALQDICITLANGGTLCLPTTEEAHNELVASIQSLRANTITLPPSLINTFEPSELDCIRTLIFVGEHVAPSTVLKWRNDRNILVNYGSTETNAALLSPVEVINDEVHFLRPSSSTRAWVVDASDHNILLTKPGVIGELVTESSIAATGYIGEDQNQNPRPGEERWINAPVWRTQFTSPPTRENSPGLQFVKTGDLFELKENGYLRLVGRKDAQIKIRGQRLDPSEVEFHISAHVDGISELACVKGKFMDSSKETLVVFFAFATKGRRDAMVGLDEILLQHIPSYMVPAGFIEVDHLPRTASGKVDRKAMQNAMSSISITKMISYDDNNMVASSHHWSRESLLLRSLWIKVLPSMTEQEIDLSSNFFRMGGDSTDAMRLVRLSRENGISSLSVSLVMRFPNLGEMADAIISGGEAQLTATTTATTTTTTTTLTPSQNDSYSPFSLLEDMKRENVLSQAALQCQISLKHIADIYPCTLMQAGLMALTAHHPGAYWAKHKFELPSDWDLSRAETCWQQVMAGNAILRTRIIQLNTGECFQVVPFPSRPGETLGTATFISTESSAFCQPLFEYTFEKNPSDSKVYMHWTIHHAIYDGWSTRLMLQALFDSYTADCMMIHSYPFFSSFVHYIMQNDGLESSKYWGHHLDGYEEQSFPRAAPSSVRPSAKITKTVSWKSKSSSVTASSTIRAAWAIVLSKYCSSPDIVFGVVVNGRSAAVLDTERIMGPTICTLPFRVKVEADLTIQDLLESIQRQSGDMIPHEQFGLPGILALGEHGPAQATRFQSLVIVQPEELPVGSEHAQIKEIIEGVDSYLTYPVTLECVLSHDCITLTLTIDESSISAFEAECLLNHFQHVFETIQRPSMGACKASTIDLITQSERAHLTRWSAPVEPAVISSCIEEVIINHSSQWLASDAVCSWDGNLTYSQLFSLSTALAAKLTLKGVEVGAIIPIAHEKSLWTVVAMLAVLQAGGAFLLVDGALPMGRVQTMFDAVNAQFLICSPAQQRRLAKLTALSIVCLDEEMQHRLRAQSRHQHSPLSPYTPRAKPHDPAYVVFTSGTTGVPKGTVLEHGQVASGFYAQVERGLFRPNWRMLQFAAYNFDPCIADMIGPLLVGGCVCIPKEEERLTELATIINRFDVDIVELTPSVANILDPLDVPSLKVLRLGGEAVTSAQVERWAGHVFLENSYGPSECCITCAITPQVTQVANPANFGAAIGCHLWIVDINDRTKLAPIGIIGELAVQGPNVGRGYINNLEASRHSFLSRPPWLLENEEEKESPASRVYMTGDLVKYHSDGTLIFVGRRDDQIKLRGQRIELGEIEHAALQVEELEAAVAFVLGSHHSGSVEHLALALSLRKGSTSIPHIPLSRDSSSLRLFGEEAIPYPEIQRLEQALTSRLPKYMIPWFCLIVDELPMSNSGKMDRKGVQKWAESLQPSELERFRYSRLLRLNQNNAATEKISPTDSVAITLKSLLALLIGSSVDEDAGTELDDILIASSGLDSIRSVSYVRSINQHFNVRMAMKNFLRQGTIKELAREVDRLRCPSPVSDDMEDVDIMLRDLDDLTSRVNIGEVPESTGHRRSLGNVFLTGATGYVGTILLNFLLNHPGVRCVCVLVRAGSPEAGLQRIVKAAAIAGWWKESYRERIQVWLGDLARPQLGLSNTQWGLLALAGGGSDESSSSSKKDDADGSIHTIIHNGALVNWCLSYSALRAANVDSTVQLLYAVAHNPAIRKFLFVSGGSQWDPNDGNDCLDEIQLTHQLRETNGYGQSKLVAEQLVARLGHATSRGATALATLKPGLVIGSQENGGVANLDDFLWRLVSGCFQLGSYCEESDPEGWIYVARGEDIARTVINELEVPQLSSSTSKQRKMLLGLRVERFWAAVNAALDNDRPLRSMNHHDWLASLSQQVSRDGPQHPCWPVIHMIEQQGSDLLGSPRPRCLPADWEQGEEIMAAAVTCNVRYLQKIGFLGGSDDSKWRRDLDCFVRGRV